ncbi:TonB-dependent receptor [Xanthomonas hortorum pv. hederae]|nr:TonB-dependent receptor [Xanthomonas hortorum pv. hederae]PUF01419.1 TonB-dependent receptor [Xanthomonas hortorum pv. hederae]
MHTAAAQTAPVAGEAADFNIAAGELAGALDRFSTQSGIQIVYQRELVQGRQSPALAGRMTWREALGTLLQGSGLEFQQVSDATMLIRRAESSSSPAVASPSAAPQVAVARQEPATELERIMVTGTRIRGGSTPSPVITIGQERIQEEGFSDLGEVIRSIPQNFSGGQNPAVMTATSSGNVYNQNSTGGASLNLRGIGADATLTLLNGRRMSYGGFGQTVDISAIPVEAVERIEIVADGASAIYGSDAVGGVGNVILKRDFDGLTVGARYGDSSNGGLATHEYSATAGTTWASGGLIATYKDVSVDSIHASQRDYTEHMGAPFVLYPGSELQSGLLSAHQSLGDTVELRVDALRTERELESWYQIFSGGYYDNQIETTTTLVAPSADLFLLGDWSISVGGAWGKDENITNASSVTTATGASVLSAHWCYCNESRSYEVGAEGPLFGLRGGDARLAVGAGYRTNDFLNQSFLTGSRAHGAESSRSAYAELSLPLISPDLNVAGVRRLALTAAARAEDYDSFGGVTTPKFGVIYDPSADFTLKASWGRSFKAPMLSERYGNQYAYLLPPSMLGGVGYPDDATVLMSWGSNRDLNPERARTVTASLAFHPDTLPGLEAELTWFDIDYSERVIQPLRVFAQALTNPAFAEFINFSPTVEEQAELIATYSYGFYNQTGSEYDPANVAVIAYGQLTNAMRQRIKGVDLSSSYRFDLGNGALMLRGTASWLDSAQQYSAGQSAFDLAGTIFYPAKFNSRIGVVYAEGGFTASAFANHTDGVTDRVAEQKTASFTTFDATLRYEIGGRRGALSGLGFALSAQNLFDRAPPLYSPIAITDVPYDSTNYSAIGRFLSASVSKSW